MAIAGATAPGLMVLPVNDRCIHVLHAQNVGTQAMPATVDDAIVSLRQALNDGVYTWILSRHAVELRRLGYLIAPAIGVE